jgi:hypothetical protein
LGRDLGDVIEYFIPEAARGPRHQAATAPDVAPMRATQRTIGLPVAAGDVLRAAVAWNLSVEISRTGAPCTLVARGRPADASLWPPPGRGPLGSRLVEAEQSEPLVSLELGTDQQIVLDCPPAEGLGQAAGSPGAPRHWLLLSAPDPDALRRVRAQALEIAAAQPDAHIGATIHGVRRIDEARAAFEELAVAVEADSSISLTSYGLLVDDLHLYRAIVAQRPIGLAHPAAPATRALADVARLLLEDLGEAVQ